VEDFKRFVVKHGGKTIFILFILFCFKSCQSCDRERAIEKNTKRDNHVIDSMNLKIISLVDSIKVLKNDFNMEKNRADYADKRANSIESVSEHIKTNSNIKIYIPEQK